MEEKKLSLVGVDATLKAIAGLRVIAVTGAAVLEEGLEFEDLEDILAGVKHAQEVVDAYKAIPELTLELKDLDMVEAGLMWAALAKTFNDTKRAANGEKNVLG